MPEMRALNPDVLADALELVMQVPTPSPQHEQALRVLVVAVRRFKRLHDDIAISSERAPLPPAPGATEER